MKRRRGQHNIEGVIISDMHILILVNSLTSGGAERVTVNLSSYLVEKGHKVTVVTGDSGKDFYTLDSRIERIDLGHLEETVYLNRTTAYLKQFTILHIIVKIIRGFMRLPLINRLSQLRILGRTNRFPLIRKVIKQQQPDIVLGMITSNSVRAIIASLGLSAKVIATERNFPGRKKASPRWARLRKMCYRFADGHVVQTHKIACWVKKHTRASNITIIPNSVAFPIPSFLPVLAPQKVISKEYKVILAVGKLHEQKGFDLLISAFHRINQYVPGWKLVILGKDMNMGGEQQNLQRQIDELDLNDKVKLPGRAGNISDWYHRSDIFVLSSRYEGFPNVLLEAMANGCSCISYDCDTGPSEIIINEENGILIPSEDIASLADAMERLAKDEKLRARIAANAIRVREDFSEHKIMGMWTQFFEEVLESEVGLLRKIAGSRKALDVE